MNIKNLFRRAPQVLNSTVKPSFKETLKHHFNKRDFAGLTGGIALADAGVRAATAKDGQRGRAALRGLGEGAIYGTILSSAEPTIKAVLEHKGWLK